MRNWSAESKPGDCGSTQAAGSETARPDCNLEPEIDDSAIIWLDPEVIPSSDGYRLERRSGIDSRTGRAITRTTRFNRPDGSLESRGKVEIDQLGNQIVRGEYRRSDGSLEFRSHIHTDPESGYLIGEYNAYRPDGSRERRDRNYIDQNGNSVVETSLCDLNGDPLGQPTRVVIDPQTGRWVNQPV